MEMSMALVLVHFSISYTYKYCNIYAVNNLGVINEVEVSSPY